MIIFQGSYIIYYLARQADGYLLAIITNVSDDLRLIDSFFSSTIPNWVAIEATQLGM